MDATETGLLREIVERPADTGVRLVLADWLEERGGPGDAERSEFIRGQCELAESQPPWKPAPDPGACLTARHEALRRRDGELLRAHGYAWLPLPLMTLESDRAGQRCKYRRGFIERVELTTAAFLRHAAALALACPLREVRLTDKEPYRGMGDASWRVESLLPEGQAGPNYLPTDLFVPVKWLELGQRNADAPPGYLYEAIFTTAAEAHTALSAACISLARAEAGLPRLGAGEGQD